MTVIKCQTCGYQTELEPRHGTAGVSIRGATVVPQEANRICHYPSKNASEFDCPEFNKAFDAAAKSG